MKTTQKVAIIVLSILFILSLTSCVVSKKDNGKHKGWYKNSKNPHHPASTKSTGSAGKSGNNANGNGHGSSKSKSN